jgi:alpha-1,2-mannosyltransferase
MSLLVVSGILLFIILVAYFKRTIVAGGVYGASDFFKFYESALFYFSGQNIYSNDIIELRSTTAAVSSTWVTANGNLNPPFFTLLLLPLHFFNYARAYQVWNMFTTAFFLLGPYLALRPFPQWHKYTLPIITLFALYLPNSANLAYGQITSILLVILTAAWLLSRKNKDISAGVCIGLACAIKLFCGLFLIYFLCLKRFRLISSSLITIFMTSVVALWVFGFQAYVAYHTMLNTINWYAASWNVSFFGFFTRLFSNVEHNVPLVIAPHLVNIFTVLCSIPLVIYLAWIWKKWGAQKFDIGFSLVLVSMLLLSPLGWTYYFPLLIIPYLVLVRDGNWGVHLGCCFLLFISTLTGNLLRTPMVKTKMQVLLLGGTGFYALLGLLLLLSLVGYGVGKSRSQENQESGISESLWIVIYSIIFIPSLISLGAIFRDLYLCT